VSCSDRKQARIRKRAVWFISGSAGVIVSVISASQNRRTLIVLSLYIVYWNLYTDRVILASKSLRRLISAQLAKSSLQFLFAGTLLYLGEQESPQTDQRETRLQQSGRQKRWDGASSSCCRICAAVGERGAHGGRLPCHLSCPSELALALDMAQRAARARGVGNWCLPGLVVSSFFFWNTNLHLHDISNWVAYLLYLSAAPSGRGIRGTPHSVFV